LDVVARRIEAAAMTTAETARVPELMERLIGSVREVAARGLDPAPTAGRVAGELRGYLGTSVAALLRPDQVVGAADCYRQHLLHAERDGSFSVVALVWLPGQRTPVHDHVAWCVTGVLQGQESERRYRLVDGRDGTRRLEVTEEVVSPVGAVAGFAPPGDIHEVWNGGPGTAISLHIYGADVSRLSTSVRRTYDLSVV
jgi:predicted metal-dependent enzyme (double-stranded beta helix superfamily)